MYELKITECYSCKDVNSQIQKKLVFPTDLWSFVTPRVTYFNKTYHKISAKTITSFHIRWLKVEAFLI